MDKSIEDRIITDQIHKDVRKLIELLPDEQREVLYMRHYAEMSFKDIAEVTGVSINTALRTNALCLDKYAKIDHRKEYNTFRLNTFFVMRVWS